MQNRRKFSNRLRVRFSFELAIAFVLFLHKRNCLDSYSKLTRRYHGCTLGNFLFRTIPEYWITGAFVHANALEGTEFWTQACNDWDVFLNEFYL